MRRVGVWLIGARGSIASVTVAGQAVLAQGRASPVGLVTARPEFEDVELVDLSSMVFGGHEIRRASLRDAAGTVLASCGVGHLMEAVGAALDAADEHVRPGILRGATEEVSAVAEEHVTFASDAAAIAAARADFDAFKAAHGLRRLVVVNLASTEPRPPPHPAWADLDALREAVQGSEPVLPPSALYAFAALSGGDAYINFTPSLGSDLPALRALALETGAVHMGVDGKTGETLAKSILAELFVRRNLRVLSWFGQNILGNEDGRVLRDPANKSAKIRTKDHLLPKILGYPTETHVGIDYVESLGEWKVAWDHIHFEGFLGGRMNLQFTWSGVDSLLAAPLVLDLVRLADLAQRRGERGVLPALAQFFKHPMDCDEQRLVRQDEALIDWARGS